jgi:hypothetical protein
LKIPPVEVELFYAEGRTDRQKVSVIKLWTALTSVEKKYFRRTSRYNCLDHERNEEILEELKPETS